MSLEEDQIFWKKKYHEYFFVSIIIIICHFDFNHENFATIVSNRSMRLCEDEILSVLADPHLGNQRTHCTCPIFWLAKQMVSF